MADARLLIVDDDGGARKSLARVFEDEGYLTSTAGTGAEAVEMAGGTDFDAALVTCGLPDMDGLEVLRAMRAVTPEIICMIVTGHASRENAVEALKAGADDYFPKPLNIEEVSRRLGQVLEKQRLRRSLRESEEKLRSMADTALDSIIMIDNEARIIYWNPAAERTFGYSKSEALGEKLHSLIVPERHRDALLKGFSEFRETGGGPLIGTVVEMTALRKDGTEFPVEHSISALKIKGRWCSAGIIRDITERKEAEEKIALESEITRNLLKISEATAQMTDIDMLLDPVVHNVRAITGCDICLAYLWDADLMCFRPSQGAGLTAAMAPLFRTDTMDIEVPFVKEAFDNKRAVAVEGGGGGMDAACGGCYGWIGGLERLVAVPLTGKRLYLGLMVCVYRKGNPRAAATLTEKDNALLQGIGNQVSVSLEEARHHKDSIDKAMRLSYKIKTIEAMHDIDRAILSTLDPQEVLDTAANMIARIIVCDKCTVALVDREKGGFTYAAGYGAKSAKTGTLIPFEQTSATEVVETLRPQYVSDLREIEGQLPAEGRLLGEGFLSHIRIPLLVRSEAVGVLHVGSRRPASFSPEDLSTLEKLTVQIGVALENSRLMVDMQELLIGTIRALSKTIDAKSPWTRGHSERVTVLGLEIAGEMGLGEKERADFEISCLLHDIGKLGTYEAILDKAEPLTVDEILEMQKHPAKGAEILAPIKQLHKHIPAIRHHHENYDGTGYPGGLRGDAIPLRARILAVADTVDAMGSDRPYRKGRPLESIAAEIKRCSGTQFDPAVVEAFLSVLLSPERVPGPYGLRGSDTAPRG
ncbi:MAG: HD domain-containing phosphohydrolase [Thermodesulfobacteriota bacterium]